MLRVLDELAPNAEVSASLVWVRVLPEDGEQAARAAAARLQQPRLSHFYDRHQRAAREMAAALGGAGHLAWDVYLVFPRFVTWADEAPEPADWVHQLDQPSWAPVVRQHKGEALVQAIHRMIHKAINPFNAV